MADQLPEPPPASERQGGPGHDQALDYMVGARLLQMRANGMTYAQIAQEAGYRDGSGARLAILRALDRHEAENAAELRALEGMRLDADERTLRTLITDTSLPAKDRIAAINSRTRVSARRARLFGLDAPLQVAISAGVAADLGDALTELETVLGEVVHLHPAPDQEQPPALEA